MLKRARQTMPDFVRKALADRGLKGRYDARPAYQRNDYLAWIKDAKRDDTRSKRLGQMLDELSSGGRYMKMEWKG